MSGMASPFAETLSRILGDHVAKSDRSWPSALWQDIEQAGFPQAMLAEDKGGAALRWEDLWPILSVAGESAAAAPLADAILAQWLARAANLTLPPGLAVPAFAKDFNINERYARKCFLSGTMPRVPWGRHARSVVILLPAHGAVRVALVSFDSRPSSTPDGVTIEAGTTIAGEPRDTIQLVEVQVMLSAKLPFSETDVMAMAAAIRSALMAGALSGALAATLDHARLRVQFGRSLTGFQAIQQQLARFATETASAIASSQAALEAIDAILGKDCSPGSVADSISVCAAKIRAGEAAGKGAAIAHQIFGAIGFTVEHPLHRLTTRLWGWREEYGNEAWWSRHVGMSVVAAGPDHVWEQVTKQNPGDIPIRVAMSGGAA